MRDLHRSPVKGRHAWAIVVAVILVIDLSAQDEQTLSAACWRAQKRHPTLVWAALISTLLHLALGNTSYSRWDVYRLIELLRRQTAPRDTRVPKAPESRSALNPVRKRGAIQ